MFSIINRKVDYPLQSLLGFDIHKIPLKPFYVKEPSLTLISTLYTQSKPILALSKKDKQVKKSEKYTHISKIADDVESLLYSNNYQIPIHPVLIHEINEEIENINIAHDLTVLNNQYIFFESPQESIPKNINDSIFNFQIKNLNPVLVSPEKSEFFTIKLSSLDRLYERGCRYQIDALSLSGHYGSEARKTSIYLLERKKIKFIAFELKSLEHIRSAHGIRVTRKVADLLCEQLFSN